MVTTGEPRPAVPRKPGVYLIRDRRGRVIYVGKARNLRNRLRTYTGRSEGVGPKVATLRSRMAGFDYIVTESETEALVLESNLIKEHRPRYNVRLKDDKRFPFIKVTLAEDFPRAYVTRLVRQDGSRYFGPYTDAKAMRRTLRHIRQLFPARQCSTFKLRPRPCLNFQIGRCLGPCRGSVTTEEYGEIVRQLCLFLDGRAGDVADLLEEQMAVASEDLRFEEAASLRDRIADVEKVIQRQRVLSATEANRDALAVARNDRLAVGAVIRVRQGKLVACESCPLDAGADCDDEEVVETFIKQFYNIAPDTPGEILVDRDLSDTDAIGAWLTRKSGHRVVLRAPKRGEKRLLVGFARENAEQALKRAFEARRPPASVAELGEALGMTRPPRLIAGVDISNVAGAHAVGTVVTFRDGRPNKKLYRRYRIRTVKGSDDYAMIREVVGRHLKGILKDGAEPPDLFVIDGGKGQLSAAGTAVRASGLRGVALAALAKREEEVFVPGRATPLPLPEDGRPKKLLQRVRNEVHRFSIAYHRKLRERSVRRSLLDDIPGVGSARKEALLERFGSVAAIGERTIDELTEVPGIGVETAKRIKRALEEAGGRDRPRR